jgi:hypothetical protein
VPTAIARVADVMIVHAVSFLDGQHSVAELAIQFGHLIWPHVIGPAAFQAVARNETTVATLHEQRFVSVTARRRQAVNEAFRFQGHLQEWKDAERLS